MLDHFRALMASLIDRVPTQVELDMHNLVQTLERRFQALEVKVGILSPAVPPAVPTPPPVTSTEVSLHEPS